MSYIIANCVERIRRCDFTLNEICLTRLMVTDAQFQALANDLLKYPTLIERMWLASNQLTDYTGLKLARYVARSSTIQTLILRHNNVGIDTCLAFAKALYVNTSLISFDFINTTFIYQTMNRQRVIKAFVVALILNPCRQKWISFILFRGCDYYSLKKLAEQSTPPSMLEFLLCVQLDTENLKTKKH